MISQYLCDCFRAGIAFVVFVPLFVFPGYILGEAADVFRFRSHGFLTRVCLSLGFSVAITPIILFMLWTVSIQWAIAAYYLSAAIGIGFILKNRRRISQIRIPGVLVLIGVAWILIVLFSLVDFPIGNGLYVNGVSNPDHAYRVEIIAHLARSANLPPSFPFLAGDLGKVTLRYHYFWFMVCGMIPTLTGWRIGARDALIASVVWIGILLLAVIALYWKFFFHARDTLRNSIASIPVLLLGGLQGAAFWGLFFLHGCYRGSWRFPYATLTWIEPLGQITYWFDSCLWVPNHVAAVLASLVAMLALYVIPHAANWRQRAVLIVLAGFSLASTVGLSVFVGMPFFAFLGVLCVYHLFKAPRRRLWIELASALGLAVFLVAPYLLTIRAPAGSPPPLVFSVRPSRFVDIHIIAQHLPDITPLGRQLLYLVAEPLVVFFELGMMAVVAIWAFARCKSEPSKEARDRDNLVGLFAFITIVLVLFVSSGPISGGGNDLGWRAPLGTLFLLVFYGVMFFDVWRSKGLASLLPSWACKFRPMLVLLVVLGFGTTLTEFLVLRFASVVNITREEAVHTADLRAALDFLRHNSAPEAVVQLNPEKDNAVYSGLFMERRTALRAGDMVFYHHSGFDSGLIRQTENAIEPIFADAGLKFEQVQQSCASLGIDYLVFQPGDTVFNDDRSWIWRVAPLYVNQSVRVYRC
jgi:hypothetical protein